MSKNELSELGATSTKRIRFSSPAQHGLEIISKTDDFFGQGDQPTTRATACFKQASFGPETEQQPQPAIRKRNLIRLNSLNSIDSEATEKKSRLRKTPSLGRSPTTSGGEPQYKSNKQNRNKKNMEDRRRASEKYRER